MTLTTVLPHPRSGARSAVEPVALPASTPAPTAERVATYVVAVAFACQPLLHPSGPGNSSPVDLFTLVGIVAVALWLRGSRRPVIAPYGLGVGLLVLAGAVTGLAGDLPGSSLLALIQDVVLFLWCIAVTNVARRPEAVRLLLASWSWAAIGWAGLLTCGWLTGNSTIEGLKAVEGNRVMFTFGDPNYAALYWVLSIFIVYASRTPARPVLRWTGYLLLLWAAVLAESNGGAVELAAGLFLLFVVGLSRRFGGPAAFAGALLALVLAAAVLAAFPLSKVREAARYSDQPLLVNSIGRSDGSAAQRSILVQESLDVVRREAPLGTGPGTTKKVLTMRHYPYAKEAHDDYLAALVERGPLGVLGLLALIAAVAGRVGRVLSAPERVRAAIVRPEGLVAAVLVLAVAGGYYEVLHFRFAWALFAVAAGVCSPVSTGPWGLRGGRA